MIFMKNHGILSIPDEICKPRQTMVSKIQKYCQWNLNSRNFFVDTQNDRITFLFSSNNDNDIIVLHKKRVHLESVFGEDWQENAPCYFQVKIMHPVQKKRGEQVVIREKWWKIREKRWKKIENTQTEWTSCMEVFKTV